ncbi:MAG: glycerol kinase GlpK [Eggerthellaceae bacterium]|nr:glycerol kinase GlpK [Eggerthellaceae bacterium]
MRKYVIALDEGTTSARSVLIDAQGNIAGVAQREFEQYYPNPGWVEHDPLEILSAQLGTMTELLIANNVEAHEVDSIGITNQRETTVVWNRDTGEPIANAIVWQCRRTASIVDALCSDVQVRQTITAKTGLIPDAYFSASKIKWLLDNVEGARELAEAGKLAFGTIDTWLIWALTDGAAHATDPTNASRTMLFDIHTMQWDEWLCDLFDIPMSMLPEVRPSSGDFGVTQRDGIMDGIPIRGVAGDQQSALFGQCCFEPGQAKNTYGTGCFLLMNTGSDAPLSKKGLVTTVAASAPGEGPNYAIEGSVFMGGALVQWIRDGLGLIKEAAETEEIALSVDSCDGVYIVPAFTGLGAPYWDSEARGAIYGLTRGTTSAHIVRAALEALAFQVYDLVGAMEADAGMPLKVLNVDGGASANNFLMQFQSDILEKPLRRPSNVETTALGAAYLAGLATGFWGSLDDLRALRASDTTYLPDETNERLAARLAGWKEAVERTKTE